MNILFLTTHLQAGGITSYLKLLVKGLLDKGCNVHIGASSGNTQPYFQDLGVPVVRLDIKTKSELSPKIYLSLPKLSKYIKDHQIDIIHSQTRVTQVMGRLLQSLTGVHYVSTGHGHFKPKLSRFLAPCWGEKVIAISTAVQEHLHRDFKVAPKKIVLIKSGVDIAQWPPVNDKDKKIMRLRFQIPGGPVIGNVARLSDVKGPDVLIRATKDIMTYIPNVRCVLFGEGKMETELWQLIRELQLDDNVFIFKQTGKTKELLNLFDCFVMPSKNEGLGLSIMEAQASGLCVVASDTGGIPSLIENGSTGVLVEKNNPQALADAIVNILKRPDQMKAMGLKARQFIGEQFTLEQMVEQTMNLYQSVLANDE